MSTETTSAVIKWIAGIGATIIGSLTIWWFTHQGGPLNPVPTPIDVSGYWQTPYKDLNYTFTQTDKLYHWSIRENGVSGNGKIEGTFLISVLDGETVEYEARQLDGNGNPRVLFTTHPKYAHVILFKSCEDFHVFLGNLGRDYPNLKNAIDFAVGSIPNPTCPNAIQ